MGTSHAMSGVAVWWGGCVGLQAAGVTPSPVVVFAGAAVAAAAALGPDLDHRRSIASRALPPVSWVVRRLFGHRGPTHYLVSAVLVGVAVGVLVALAAPGSWWVGVAVAVGWVTHLLGDACTDAGVPLLGPWSTRRLGLWRPLRFKTGDNGFRVEVWLVRPALAVWLVADLAGLAWSVG